MAVLTLPNLHHFQFLLSLSILFCSSSAVDFVFNGFNSTGVSLYGNATIDSRILTLTNQTNFSIGRALYRNRIPTRHSNSSRVLPFSTSFIFSMAPYRNTLPGHGFVFLFVPATGIDGTSSAQQLGFLNFTLNGNPNNHIFGIEFDVFKNQEFNDPNDNHVGIDLNSLTSNVTGDGGFWSDDGSSNSNSGSFNRLKLNSGENYQVWIDYSDFVINVTMAPAGMKRPRRPLLNTSINLSEIFEDEMYVGFTSSTGQLVQSHKILAWSFSNSNFSLSEKLITTGLPSFVLPKEPFTKSKWFIAGVTVGGFLILCFLSVFFGILIADHRRKARERAEMEDWELEYWPHRIPYPEIESATKGFSDENVIGIGGNGKVYKGILRGSEVAVKRISHENDGMREFLAEISSIGRLKHRNLVGLKGWCKKDKGNFLLIYDFMENGSLDKWVFNPDKRKKLNCEERIKILKNVAAGLLYLHEGWESKVLHRDIKASNVLLDKDMNGRVGDFGLARVHSHGQVASTTRVVGTMGYIAPEIVRSGRASTSTDVFGFGVLVLEVMSGRRPVEEGKPPLVEWVWGLMVKGELRRAVDECIKDEIEVEVADEVERVVSLGLVCAHPDANSRPTMRQVVQILEGKMATDGEEDETDNMKIYLLERLKSEEMWSDYEMGFGNKSHPTFEDFLKSSSTSLSWSTSVLTAR